MPDCQMRINTKKQPSIQCRACGAIKFSKNVNNFLSTIPTTLILSSLEVNLDKESKSGINFFLAGGGGCGREGCQQQHR